jgi:hypothetical protein
MSDVRHFLIIDTDPENRFFLTRTLLRHFPQAVVEQCQDLHTVLELLRTLPEGRNQTVVVAHQTMQREGHDLISALRAANASVPIVWMDDASESKRAEAAGATRFLDRKAWLLIGETVKDLV